MSGAQNARDMSPAQQAAYDRLELIERTRALTGRERAEMIASLGGLPITITQQCKPEGPDFSRSNQAMPFWSFS